MAGSRLTRRQFWPALAACAAGVAIPAAAGRAARGERYFVALAIVPPDRGEAWTGFLTTAMPVWGRHGMALRGAYRVVGGDDRLPLTHVAVIHVDSDAGFRAYLSDDDYGAVQESRERAAAFFAVADGHGTLRPGPAAPLSMLTLGNDLPQTARPTLRMALTTVGAVTGDPGPLRGADALLIRPVTGDDDPDFRGGSGRFSWALAPAGA